MDLASFSSSGPRSAISQFFGDILSAPIQGLMNTIIIVGITLGGLYVANQLSIAGAKAAMGATTGFYKGFGKYTGAKTAGGLARFLTKPTPPPTMGPPTPGVRAAIGRLGSRMGAGIRTATRRVLPTEAFDSLERFGRDSARVTFGGAIFQGMKKGSGLFKSKQAKDWECQVCHNVIRSVKKPIVDCVNGHPVAMANWQELSST